MSNVYYLSYYDFTGSNEHRNVTLSAKTKMDYIITCLAKAGERVEIISASGSTDKKERYPKSYTEIQDNVYLKKFYSFPWGNSFQKLLSMTTSRASILFELLKKRKNDIVLVYHSLGYMNTVLFAHKIKRFKLVMEVEEIYADVTGNQKTRTKELRLFQEADAYIFPTQLLDETVNTLHKPSVIAHGTYAVEPDRHCKFDQPLMHDDESRVVHCVYAGTLDPRKGGAIAAAAAEHLPSNYYVHILGFGGDKEISAMQEHITRVAKRSKAKVSYDGCLSGEDYIRFIQSCDIGLSTQNPNAAFNETSFPSKVLSYLANGLHVVSIRIPAVERSAVGDLLTYYDVQSPEEIAKAIMSVDVHASFDSRERIDKLDESFAQDLKQILKEVEELRGVSR